VQIHCFKNIQSDMNNI